MGICTGCGRGGTFSGEVLAFVRRLGTASIDDIVQQFGVTRYTASRTLCHLADRVWITRVGRGVYSADPELRRRDLVKQLQSLTTA